jgi:hypothetical protein
MKSSGLITGKRILAGLVLTMALAVFSHAAPQAKSIATVTIPPAPEQYASEPQPLTATQCGQCHTGPYRNLKDDGGRHRFACQNCHNVFHAYNPRKGNWDAIMPKCASCHAAPHGAKITDCAACHANPHAPKKIAATAQLANACFDCHGSVREQLVQKPSKHTKVACMTCHTSHGFKPSCFTCHKPHTEGQALSTCIPCHPVHQPLQIKFGKDVPSKTCAGCHAKIFNTLSKNTSKHRTVACVTCHKDRHRYIPQCSDCHGKPHKQVIHDKFPRCLTCHIDVHDLPVMPSPSNK